jgi:uncharacterized protein (TIGR02145 family)/uncharacterized repeat protein (TIGR02543 family)
MKTKFIKLALTTVFGFVIAFIISCIPPICVGQCIPLSSSSSIAVDNSSSSETAPSSSSVLPSSYSVITYTVKYDANGGIGAPPNQEKIHDIPLTLSGAMPTRPCYTFAIWNTAADGRGTSYAPGANYTTNASVTLYAQWKHSQNGIINGPSVSYGEETYKSVVICGQTWMARNLNYAADGRGKCPPNISGGCAVYGRRYDWATAMELPSNCNSSSCTSQVGVKHKGICPSGWHIPNEAELSTLVSNVESNKGCTDCAAKHLKATSGWDDGSGNGLDSYGFAALPGGIGGPPDWKDTDIGAIGHWLSSTDNASGVHSWSMGYSRDYVRLAEIFNKVNLFSVRCVKD